MKIIIEQISTVSENINEIVVYVGYTDGVSISGKGEFRFSLTNINNADDFQNSVISSCLNFANVVNNWNITEDDILWLGVNKEVGYTDGLGGVVIQNANKSTGVTLNKLTGQITTNAAALAAAAEISFIVSNSLCGANDMIVINHKSGGTLGSYMIEANAISAGAFRVTIGNVSAGSLSQAIVLQYAIIKGAVS